MKTITVQIGNSDDKLSQRDWSDFFGAIRNAVHDCCAEMHFKAGSENWQTWQNAAFVFTIEDKNIDALKHLIKRVRETYNQESVAWTEGDTIFI